MADDQQSPWGLSVAQTLRTHDQRLADHEARIDRLEVAQKASDRRMEDLFVEFREMRAAVSKQLNGTMLTVLGGVVTYILLSLLGIK